MFEKSSIAKLIQRRVVCDEWGKNCQSIPDQEETSSAGEQNYIPSSPPSSESYNEGGAGGSGCRVREGGFEGVGPKALINGH